MSRPVRAGLIVRWVAAVLLFTGGASFSDVRGPADKVRLTAVVDSPDPVTIPGEVSTLAASVAVRKVEGLGSRVADDEPDCARDRQGKRDHVKAFAVRVRWTIRIAGAVRVVEREVEVRPPFATVKLRAGRSGGMKTFALVPVSLQFDGRDGAGQLVSAGSYDYDVQADFVRTHDHGGRIREKLIDSSGVLAGVVTVRRVRPPAPVSLDAFPATTNLAAILLSGGKPPDTALLVDGAVSVALSAATTWSITRTLLEGENRFSLTARNAEGLESTPVAVSITLDTRPPPAPLVSAPPTDVTTNRVTLTGTKLAGTGVIVNGVKLVPLDGSTSWQCTVTLQPGANTFIVETFDAAGNVSITEGGQVASVVKTKPVIGDLAVTPDTVPTGQPVQIAYKLFAQVPPADNADLNVTVSVEDGDQFIRTVFSGVQQGSPTGTPYAVSFDGRDDAGQLVAVNTSYRIVVSAERANPSTQPRELVDANPKSTSVVVTGSRTVVSPDGLLKVIFRPDRAQLRIEPVSVLSARQSAVLARRHIRPLGKPYRVSVDRAFSSPVVGVLHHASPVGRYLRPYVWVEAQQDWAPIARTTWNPGTMNLGFAMPGQGLVLIGSSPDAEPPRVTAVNESVRGLTIMVSDLASGLREDRIRARHRAGLALGKPVFAGRNGVREGTITITGARLRAGDVRLYLEDWAGNGALVRLGKGAAR